jgi:hypothetical protein
MLPLWATPRDAAHSNIEASTQTAFGAEVFGGVFLDVSSGMRRGDFKLSSSQQYSYWY